MKRRTGAVSIITLLLWVTTGPAAARPHKGPTKLGLTLPANADATVTIDNGPGERFVGKPQALEPGTHTIRVKALGYRNFFLAITLAPGETKRFKVPLEPAIAVVAVQSTPAAELSIDGKSYGTTPRNLKLPFGAHQLRLHKEGFTDKTVDIDVPATGLNVAYSLEAPDAVPMAQKDVALTPRDEPVVPDAATTTTVSETSSSSHGWYSRWYVWAGAGAVVAGAVVGGLALAQHPKQPPGPSVVCGGACDAVVNAP